MEGGRWQALNHIQGWPPTMVASGLVPQAGSSLLMGEGNTVSDCTNPRRSIRLPKHKDITSKHIKAPDEQTKGQGVLSVCPPRKAPALEELGKGKVLSTQGW